MSVIEAANGDVWQKSTRGERSGSVLATAVVSATWERWLAGVIGRPGWTSSSPYQ